MDKFLEVGSVSSRINAYVLLLDISKVLSLGDIMDRTFVSPKTHMLKP